MGGMVTDFEKFMDLRLAESRSEEATIVVLELWDGRRLEDAVLDAIESLPNRKSKRLRQWVDQFAYYLQWRSLEREGWEMEKLWRGGMLPRPGDQLIVRPPEEIKRNLAEIHTPFPTMNVNSFLEDHGLDGNVVAAAAGARQVDRRGLDLRGDAARIDYKVVA